MKFVRWYIGWLLRLRRRRGRAPPKAEQWIKIPDPVRASGDRQVGGQNAATMKGTTMAYKRRQVEEYLSNSKTDRAQARDVADQLSPTRKLYTMTNSKEQVIKEIKDYLDSQNISAGDMTTVETMYGYDTQVHDSTQNTFPWELVVIVSLCLIAAFLIGWYCEFNVQTGSGALIIGGALIVAVIAIISFIAQHERDFYRHEEVPQMRRVRRPMWTR